MAWLAGQIIGVVGLIGLLLGGQVPGPAPTTPLGVDATRPAAPETPGLLATQVTVAVDREGSRRRFRATVLRVENDELTIFTAAHCISEEDTGWPTAILFGNGLVVEGVVGTVVRNPLYRPNQPKEIPGPDNAVAHLRFRIAATGSKPDPMVATSPGVVADPLLRVIPTRNPAAIAAFRAIQRAPALSRRFYPGPNGGSVAVRMIDGHGVEHAVRAGNFSNPRWLEWGRAYQPIPGDSGGGVFVMADGPDGKPRPILIGIIVGRDDRGGGASLVSLGESWVSNALEAPAIPTKPPSQ